VTADLDSRAQQFVAAQAEPAGALHGLIDLALSTGGGWDASHAALVARWCGLPVAVVHGAATSRDDGADDGRRIDVCTGLGCRWMGAERVCERLSRLQEVETRRVDCLGACHAAPVMRRAGRLHDGLTAERLEALLAGDR
jgi:NADH:ubiquinone oxidoreductase subunit E